MAGHRWFLPGQRRPSLFLLIYVKRGDSHPRPRRLPPLVLPLFVVEDALESAANLVRLAFWLSPRLRTTVEKELARHLPGRPVVSHLLREVRRFIHELRAHGSWTFADISTNDGTRIWVRFL